MNGFFITISNGLLKDQHRKRMGTAVWEFMWCIDKVTRIDEDGTGYVLGGKPIQLSELASIMEVGEDTVSINLSKLEAEGYIEKTRTPYGIVIKVFKAKKIFGKKSDLGKTPNLRETSKTPNPIEKTPNVHIDKTVDTTPKTSFFLNLPAWINKKVFSDWMEYRKELKKPLTLSTIKRQIKFLEKHKKDHVEIIENSIRNGWRGLFEIKKDFSNSDARRALEKQREEKEAEREREEAVKENNQFRRITEQAKGLALSKKV